MGTPDQPMKPTNRPPLWLMVVVIVAAVVSLVVACAAAWLYFTTEVPASEPPHIEAGQPSAQPEPIRIEPTQAQVAKTSGVVQAVLARVEAYRAERGAYPDLPSDAEGYAPLDVFLGENAALAVDAWGNALRFAVADKAVVSAGADGRFGTEDDISASLAGAVNK